MAAVKDEQAFAEFHMLIRRRRIVAACLQVEATFGRRLGRSRRSAAMTALVHAGVSGSPVHCSSVLQSFLKKWPPTVMVLPSAFAFSLGNSKQLFMSRQACPAAVVHRCRLFFFYRENTV